MANHILGSTSASTIGVNTTSAYNQIVPTNLQTLPSNAYITTLHAYFGNTNGWGESTQLLLFDSGYALRASGNAAITYGEAWQSQTLSTPYYFAGGSQVVVGWWVQQNASITFHTSNSGGWKAAETASPSSASGWGQPGSPYYQANPNWYLEWIDPCTISSVSPSTATAGQQVTITGGGYWGGSLSAVYFNGISASFTINSDTQITATVPNGYTTGNIQLSSDHGNPTIAFTEGAPSISSISPTSAISGSTVTITGSGFTDGTVSGVSFNGIAASSFSVTSNTQMTAVVPTGYTTGTLQVSTNHGNATTSFTEGPPTISSISPTSAGVGQQITITGYGYTDGTVTSVTFTPSGANPITSTYTVNSNTQITATVPNGASGSEVITVNTNHGHAQGNITIIGAHVFDGSAIQNGTPYAFDGTAVQQAQIYIFDGTTVQQAQ